MRHPANLPLTPALTAARAVLEDYDQDKGRFRKLFWDHPAIRALRKLVAENEQRPNLGLDYFSVVKCFADHWPRAFHASWHAFNKILKFWQPALDLGQLSHLRTIIYLLQKANLFTSRVAESWRLFRLSEHDILPLSGIVCTLKEAKLLTQNNFEAVLGYNRALLSSFLYNFIGLLAVHHMLTQSNFNFLITRCTQMESFYILDALLAEDIFTENNLIDLEAFNSLTIFRRLYTHLPRGAFNQDVFIAAIQTAQQQPTEEAQETQINLFVDLLLAAREEQLQPIINRPQSTHTTSVHRSVSASARKLFNRYGAHIQGNNLQETLNSFKNFLKALPNDLKNSTAKRCFSLLNQPNFNFIEDVSQISTTQLLALAYLAIQDNEQRQASLEEAQTRLVEALYEIQRGYNLSAEGRDDNAPDSRICASGAFNKIIEALVGIHPDCTIVYITPLLASLKLPKVVQEEALCYLTQLANPKTSTACITFTRLILQLKAEGALPIWNNIKDKVAKRLFDEFGSLYRNEQDPKFLELIESAESTPLNNLDQFQSHLENSLGYQHYCRQLWRGNFRLFQSSKTSNPDFKKPQEAINNFTF